MEIEHFEGVEGIKLLFEKTLQNNEKILRTVLSGRPLVYLAGEEFSERYMAERSKAKIFLKSLRLSSDDLDLPQHQDYVKHNKEVRIAPKDVKFDDSLIIWDNFVAIVDVKNISSVLIKNKKNASVMKKWFDYVWTNSE